jgi:hypothetical protein
MSLPTIIQMQNLLGKAARVCNLKDGVMNTVKKVCVSGPAGPEISILVGGGLRAGCTGSTRGIGRTGRTGRLGLREGHAE